MRTCMLPVKSPRGSQTPRSPPQKESSRVTDNARTPRGTRCVRGTLCRTSSEQLLGRCLDTLRYGHGKYKRLQVRARAV